jgi:hypothetical protein
MRSAGKLRHISFLLSRLLVIADGADNQKSSPEDRRIFKELLGKTVVQSLPVIQASAGDNKKRNACSHGHLDDNTHHDAEGNYAEQDVSPSRLLQTASEPQPQKPAEYTPQQILQFPGSDCWQ